MLMQLHVTCMQLDAACDDDGRANSRLADQGSLTGASSALDRGSGKYGERSTGCGERDGGMRRRLWLWRAVEADSASAKQRRLRFGSSQPRLKRWQRWRIGIKSSWVVGLETLVLRLVT